MKRIILGMVYDKTQILHCGCTLESPGGGLKKYGYPAPPLLRDSHSLDLSWGLGISVHKLSLGDSNVWLGWRITVQWKDD